jgi:DNA-binding GntR family transcriptional regulator
MGSPLCGRVTAADSTPLAIERLTTAERVADALREELLSGAMLPGSPMRDGELSARAGVSRTTMREALALLAREGLLVHSLHRGMEVARLATADVRDIYATRHVIERAGAEAMLTGCPAAQDELVRSVTAMAEATSRHDRRRVVEADTRFHTAIAGASGSQRLQTAAAGALLELRLVLSVTDRATGDLDDQLHQHRTLLRLFQRQDLAAVDALEEHLRIAEAMVCAAIEAVAARGARDR